MAYAAGNIVDFIRGFGERKRTARVNHELKNYLNNPEETIQAVNQIDAPSGIALNDRFEKDQAADAVRMQAGVDRKAGMFKTVTGYLRAAPVNSDYGSLLANMTPYLKTQLGASDQDITGWADAIKANPSIIASLDDKASEAITESRYKTQIVSAGAAAIRDGQVIHQQPFAKRSVIVRGGNGASRAVEFDPNVTETENTGDGAPAFAPPAPGGGGGGGGGRKTTVDELLPHIVQQESRGDYTAVNAETGALGAYQVMPATGAALAKRVGLAWSPAMMRRNDDVGRRYQDAIGKAAVTEAVESSGGDARGAALYYHGGSNKRGWGSKTNTYADEVVGRLDGGGGGGGGPRVIAEMPGKAPVDKSQRDLTVQEIADRRLPPGTVAQVDANNKVTVLSKPAATGGGKGAARLSLSAKDRGIYEGKLGTGMALERQLNRIEETMVVMEKRGSTGILGGRIPGALSPANDTFDKAVSGAKSLIAGLTKVIGSGSTSNYETQLQEAALPDRVATNPGRRESLRAIRGIVGEAMQAYNRTLNGPDAPAYGARLRNPKSGATVMWNGRGWVPMRK